MDRILKGAEELFLRYGVKTVTMEEIARQLGISKKTIYQSFQDKSELVYHVLDEHLKEREALIKDIADKAIDPIDEVLKLSEHIKDAMQNINPALLNEIQKYFPKAYKVYREHMENCIFKMLQQNLENGVKKGLYRKEINIEILTILRLKEVEMAFDVYLFPPSKFRMPEIQYQFIDHFLHGICTLKGHKLINKYRQIAEED